MKTNERGLQIAAVEKPARNRVNDFKGVVRSAQNAPANLIGAA